jgi:hypothetical protein
MSVITAKRANLTTGTPTAVFSLDTGLFSLCGFLCSSLRGLCGFLFGNSGKARISTLLSLDIGKRGRTSSLIRTGANGVADVAAVGAGLGSGGVLHAINIAYSG